MAKAWYSIHVWAGMENKIKERLESIIAEMGMTDLVERFFVPPPKIIEVVYSPEKVLQKAFYSGYILFYGELKEELRQAISEIEGVLGISGAEKYQFFRNEEVEKLIQNLVVEEIKPKPRYQFMPGDKVKIAEGPFANFIGVVDEIKPDKGKARVLVSIFGRETPVEIELTNLQKIS